MTDHGGESGLVGIDQKPDRAAIRIDGDLLVGGLGLEGALGQPHERTCIQPGKAQFIAAGGNLGQVENLIDQPEQVLSALVNQL